MRTTISHAPTSRHLPQLSRSPLPRLPTPLNPTRARPTTLIFNSTSSVVWEPIRSATEPQPLYSPSAARAFLSSDALALPSWRLPPTSIPRPESKL
eukprot:2605282-Pleurochrysis_carterae.AAC.1